MKENHIKIAYLITAYDHYNHLKRLVLALNDSNVFFYIHIDKNSSMPENLFQFKNIQFVTRHKVWWAGWSHQKVILNLMSEAVKSDYDYFALISGGDYPIKNNSYLYSILNEGGEFISIKEGFPSDMKKGWIVNFYFDLFYRRKPNKPVWIKVLLRLEKKISSFFPKRNFPFEKVFFGPTWWILSKKTVFYILDFLKSHPEYENFFKNSFCCEEILIPTIIGNSSISNLKGNLTYVDWSVNPGPAIISEKHIDVFKRDFIYNEYGDNISFFARKFNDNSTEIINKIDNILRK